MEVLIATKNEAKIKKYSTMFNVLEIEYKTLKDFDTNIVDYLYQNHAKKEILDIQ